MEVPRGVTTMIDAGAIFKFRGSYISVGSSTLQVDRSDAALQVLGTPRLVQLSDAGRSDCDHSDRRRKTSTRPATTTAV